ncbi:prolyl-tRNA synthetase associated domain-containing protein [Clostridium sp. 2-1]|uniref:prolyl-tRNA synthetase associated domain-containing protein n=1 Tax=Clostridium TaxID=1485 RepID=UPI000CDA181D|nr:MULTISPECIES: prolyl-tRNA synthetase associated domain-containing protein [Clostridium]MBN7573659.1 prolyl-tRNA synthetase associated domain-containing protein [Clostridium beijerinckii]MBN7578927.1 prolyl-tRNA synthetase associated domain-containing protein [Clostridium beijerinckii]MBN7583290.1 prolyl-tRNA synthetase associated domain-containing protein [Clostridium beijerinckii]MBO0521232.1 prolyl-tRNA synthetase associated domain-containing protein [Clostridium beijerinckii]POO92903.1 p
MSITNEQKVYEILDLLCIKYTKYEHNPIYTVEEAKNLDIDIPGGHCKNLFIRNRKGDTHYLVVLDENKRVDLKALDKQIGSTRLSFASEERLYKYLKLTPGSVTPFGLINDSNREVIVLVDKDLANQDIVNFHPNVNTATIGISYKDFEKFILWRKNEFKYIEI